MIQMNSPAMNQSEPSRFSRRDLLRLGGIGLISTTILAACSKNDSTAEEGIASIGTIPPGSPLPKVEVTDVVLLRTAASVESNAIDMYNTVLDAGYFVGDFASTASVARRFRDDHTAHVAEINALVVSLGGTAFECANAHVNSLAIQPALDLIATKDNPDVALDAVNLAHAVETLVAQMHQGFVGQLDDPKLRGSIIHIGQNDVRHAVVLAQLLNPGLSGVQAIADATTGISNVVAVPSAFGGLAIIRPSFGPPNADGLKAVVPMETPSLNAMIYEYVSC